MIYVFTGKGKGKTSAALGMAIRSLGWGRKIVVVKFMKGRESGEDRLGLKNYKVYKFGRKEFVSRATAEDKELARKGLKFAERAKCDLLVLDELNTAIKFGLLKFKDIKKVLDRKLDIIVTGRGLNLGMLRKADVVTKLIIIKKPWKYNARKGLEF